MRIFQANGIFTSERGYFWDNHFNLTSIIFVGILILLIWGIFAWFQERKKENLKSNQNPQPTGNEYRYNREYEQAKLREEALFDDDGDIDGIPSVIEQITKEQNEIDHKNS